MKSANNSTRHKNRGTVLIISLIFVIVLSTLAVSLASFSGVNVQLAENQSKLNHARACAESGMDVVRFWLSRVSIPGTTCPSERCSQIAASLQNELAVQGITNITAAYDGSTISIPNVTLDSEKGESFSAIITPLDTDTLQVEVTGLHDSITKAIRAQYYIGEQGHSVFDFGVASKGPLSLSGNVDLEGYNVSVEASVYIESENSNLALSITGNSQIAGNVSIANPIASVELQGGNAGIGGQTGQDAIDNHVSFGVTPSDFPEPVPSYFEPYTTTVIDSNTDTTSEATFENPKILANTNPTFTAQMTLKGIIYIETPNVVNFTGGANITGIIVGDGDINDDSGDNRIVFGGNVSSHPVSELPDEARFEWIKEQAGTFVIAPGFHVSFGGNFDALCGAIAGNGVEFYGNAGGIINGSIINYSGEQMILSGNSDLYFNRSGTNDAPAGFVPELVLEYNPASYSELML
jgi:Tfp pilus assembly protein PilX